VWDDGIDIGFVVVVRFEYEAFVGDNAVMTTNLFTTQSKVWAI